MQLFDTVTSSSSSRSGIAGRNSIAAAIGTLLKAAGKAPKVAITAIMQKLVVLANVLLRDGRKWEISLP
jgi:hypothetical protein